MNSRTMRRAAVVLGVLAVPATRVVAQGGAPAAGTVSEAVARTADRARALVERGEGADARVLLDSLVSAQASGSNDLAEALYWRATLAERGADAERDWKRLVIESPLSPRTADALVRLGEFETLRGRTASARTYFERVVKDYPDTPQRAKSTLWIVRGWFDERNAAQACTALATLDAASVPDGELRLQYGELGRACATRPASERAVTPAAPTPVAPTPAAPTPATATPAAATPTRAPAQDGGTSADAPASGGRFSVQLAAYDTRAEAEASVRRLKGRGITARVDGEVKPFRVRTGRYETRADANVALAKLKKQGLSGFVAERTP